MPPHRGGRSRTSLTPNGGGNDDISTLTLTEVRSRLERNERVLNSSLFAPSPPPRGTGVGMERGLGPDQMSPGGRGSTSLSTSPVAGYLAGIGDGGGRTGMGMGVGMGMGMGVGGPSPPLPRESQAFAQNQTAAQQSATGAATTTTATSTGTGAMPIRRASIPINAMAMAISPGNTNTHHNAITNAAYSNSHPQAYSYSPTNHNHMYAQQTPTHNLSTSPFSPPADPMREKLLEARQALLARERELLLEQGGDLRGGGGGSVAGVDMGVGMMDTGGGGSSTGTGMGLRSGVGVTPRREVGSPGLANGRSGKQRALEVIRQSEGNLAPNSLILPIAQTLELGERDYTNATLSSFSSLSLSRPVIDPYSHSPQVQYRNANSLNLNHQSHADSHADSHSSNKQEPYTEDEGRYRSSGDKPELTDDLARVQALARINAFMAYKPSPGGGEVDDEDFDFGFDSDGDGEGMEFGDGDGDGDGDGEEGEGNGYMEDITEISGGIDKGTGPSGRSVTAGRAKGIPAPNISHTRPRAREKVDKWGEDDERWQEGNEEYGAGDGGGSWDAGPDR